MPRIQQVRLRTEALPNSSLVSSADSSAMKLVGALFSKEKTGEAFSRKSGDAGTGYGGRRPSDHSPEGVALSIPAGIKLGGALGTGRREVELTKVVSDCTDDRTEAAPGSRAATPFADIAAAGSNQRKENGQQVDLFQTSPAVQELDVFGEPLHHGPALNRESMQHPKAAGRGDFSQDQSKTPPAPMRERLA